ncbi:hypothetical protein BKA58DRAFT_404518 [Alternaria rosae]|uniref:uncharacterized protein n=1 Tax=Alternaria rosae TaxID=1187941 RepID=UPI001E8E28BF|nr:uncharacterized protein BKA58DRAFT_404518 [Alternaria rosae]KAH6865989.1 hypothetical protein BKA58DRAFT_404518 [Alternaria rosae]
MPRARSTYLAQSISSEIRTSATMRENNCKDSLAAQTALADQLKTNLDDEERGHATKLENLKNQCDAQEQAHAARQTELENELETTKQALDVARNNHTAIVEEWNQKPFRYLGCYQAIITNRVIHDIGVTLTYMSVSRCEHICQSYRYYGLEAGDSCLCGNALRYNPVAQPSKCTTKCTGNAAAKCGGNLAMDIYEKII